MKKLSLTAAALLALIIVGAPIAAKADSHPSANVFHSGVQIHQDDDDEDDFDDDGDDDADDEHKKGWIPPVFVVPGGKHGHHKPSAGAKPTAPVTVDSGDDIDGDSTANSAGVAGLPTSDTNDFIVVGVDDTDAANSLESVDTSKSEPIAIERVVATTQTPADRFMDTAYLGIGILGASAIGLASTTMIRSYRLRKSGKSDYFYDN